MLTHNPQRAGTAHPKRVFHLFGSCAPRARTMTALLLGTLLTLSIPGCGWGQSKDEPKPAEPMSAEGVFDDDGLAPGNESAWSIILATLPEDREELVNAILRRVRSTPGLESAYATTRAGNFVIAYGRYDGPNDTNALRDLDRIKETSVDGSRPYLGAYIAPPSAAALSGANDEYDLRTVKSRVGDWAVYTLQVGVYGTDDSSIPGDPQLREFRRAAEAAVRELRAEGDQAFYYHAPYRSMVTVGVFGESDFDASTTPPIESQRLREVRKKYPNNLLNGKGIRETITNSAGQRVTRLQPSNLVAIPD